MPPTIRCTATRKEDFSTATIAATATCRSISSMAGICSLPSSAGRHRRFGRRKEEIARIVAHVRQAWPEVEIWLRADTGFARES